MTVDGLLFKLASSRNDGSLMGKLTLSSLSGALVFHVATGKLLLRFSDCCRESNPVWEKPP
jgi:hypothetical protein